MTYGRSPEGADGEGLRVRVHDVSLLPRWRRGLGRCCRGTSRSSDWTQDNANYFRAIRIA